MTPLPIGFQERRGGDGGGGGDLTPSCIKGGVLGTQLQVHEMCLGA